MEHVPTLTPPHDALGPAIGDYRAPRARQQRRIVYLWDADYPWDVRTEKICATLTSAGHDVHVVARNKAHKQLIERLPEGTVHRMPPWKWLGATLDRVLGFPAFFSPRWLSLLDHTVRTIRPDVIIGRDIPLAPTAIWVGQRRNVPVVLDVAEHYPAMMRMIFDANLHKPTDYLVRNPAAVSAVERYALRRADRVLVVIEEMAERLERMGIPAERVNVVSNTPPRMRAEAEPKHSQKPEGTPLELVYLGLLEVSRGIGELIDAAALLRDQGRRVHLTLVGSGRDTPIFKAQAQSRKLTEQDVSFLGYVDRNAALGIVSNADIGVLPNHANEAWNTTIPNKLFDYMAAELPVVSSTAGPFARIVRATGAGEVFESGDPRSLADAILRLWAESDRRRCGAAGRKAVYERYNWEHDTEILLRAVEAAASRGR